MGAVNGQHTNTLFYPVVYRTAWGPSCESPVQLGHLQFLFPLIALEAGKCYIEVMADSVSGESLLPGS